MARTVKAQSFEALTQKFLAAARQDKIPNPVAEQVVNVNRGPVTGVEALVTWMQWYHASPGDPIGNLTIAELRKRFQGAAVDWGRTQKAVEALGDFLTEPQTMRRVAERARTADWGAVRAAVHGAPKGAKTTVQDDPLTMPLSLARRGLVESMIVETIRSSAEAATANATLLSALDAGGAASLAQVMEPVGVGVLRRRHNPYARAAANAGGFVIGYSALAVLGAAAGIPTLAAGAAGAAIVFGGYAAKRLYEEGFWD